MLDGPWHAAFLGGNKLVKLVHNAVKSGFFELYFLFCLSWTHKWKSAYSFLSWGSYLNMYHGYQGGCKMVFYDSLMAIQYFTEKEHFLPVFTEKEHFLKRALFQHILRGAKST